MTLSFPFVQSDRISRLRQLGWLSAAFAGLVIASGATAQQSYKTPEEAVAALVDAARSGSTEVLLTVLGTDSEDIVSSGDDVADVAGRQRFIQAYDAKHAVELEGDDKAELILGVEEWPFPIPLVREDGEWIFDAEAGRDEILARRIGRNELNAIQAVLAYVDAQNEYAEAARTNEGIAVYAQRIVSRPGEKDGLYWPAELGGESPLGDLVAQATAEGYSVGQDRAPFHGYYYKVLTRQGASASGGAYDYVAGDKMIGGFALVAYPAEYENSGVMTFLVNHEGIVFQKDLGAQTGEIVDGMTEFNPDDTWQRAEADEPAQ
ncbi:MAG: DUF2950 domain-containing protein [Hyphomicrobium sp.]